MGKFICDNLKGVSNVKIVSRENICCDDCRDGGLEFN